MWIPVSINFRGNDIYLVNTDTFCIRKVTIENYNNGLDIDYEKWRKEEIEILTAGTYSRNAVTDDSLWEVDIVLKEYSDFYLCYCLRRNTIQIGQRQVYGEHETGIFKLYKNNDSRKNKRFGKSIDRTYINAYMGIENNRIKLTGKYTDFNKDISKNNNELHRKVTLYNKLVLKNKIFNERLEIKQYIDYSIGAVLNLKDNQIEYIKEFRFPTGVESIKIKSYISTSIDKVFIPNTVNNEVRIESVRIKEVFFEEGLTDMYDMKVKIITYNDEPIKVHLPKDLKLISLNTFINSENIVVYISKETIDYLHSLGGTYKECANTFEYRSSKDTLLDYSIVIV